MNKWWGYEHIDGAFQVKRFFDQEDLDEAKTSPFAIRVSEAFEAENRQEALKILRERWCKV